MGHAQNIVTIQESLAIQNDTMKKVESERQNAAAKAKEDIDATSAANTKAINEMKDHFSTALSSLEITLKKEQNDGNSNLSDKLQQVENDLGSRMLVLEKSGPESLKTFGSQLEEKLQEMNKDLELKLKETDGKTNKNANDIASQSNMLREHTESINSNITSISSISIKIAAFDKDLDGLTKQVGSNATEIGLLKENHGSQVARVSYLEGKVKLNQDHIKNIDDTLDGLKHSIDVFEGRHIETVEKMKEVTVLAGAIQTQVKEQEEKIVEQSNSNLNLVKDQIKDLENQQGVSAQKITELDSGIQSMLEKVLGVEKNLGDGLSRLDSADKNILENLQTSKSETMNMISLTKKEINESFESTIKKMTEEYSSLNSSFNVQIEEVNQQIKTLNDASTRHAQIMHSVELLGDKMNNIDEKQPKIKAELERLEASMLSITEKVFSLEESIVIQVEKSKFVESLNARVTQLDEMRQQSDAKSRETSESSNMKLSKEIFDLKNKIETNSSTIGILGPRIDKIEVDMNRSIESVTEKIRQTSDETNNMFEKMKEDMKSSLVSTEDKMNLIRNGMQSIQAENDSCFNDHELKLQKILSATEEHSNFFTTITSNMASMENTMSSYDSKQKAVTENLLITSEAQLNEFRNKFDSRITEIMRKVDSHSDQFDQNELNLVDLKRKFDENYVHTQRDLDEIRKKISNEKEVVVMKIREHKESLESFFSSLEEKIELIETTQIKESSRVEVIEKNTESLERLSLQFEKRIKDVEKLGEDTSALWKELSELQEYSTLAEKIFRVSE